ncbi:Rpl2 (apicoplast) [Theileria orientalis strain Shintoku]|uniref:Rpl2 n=1 Tax=Theileria orientalis strain Shintoku TaxID=869250 RepID=J7MF94_THEOR|nr:Rpl2 [Theileria orientalis strain Shintoku]BAM42529.1 Rpl2 [Theileria orientalis strain Shintoku]|eukprot:XP_012965620.1 Rpl2 [Theileria orientalis strain Shintoku]
MTNDKGVKEFRYILKPNKKSYGNFIKFFDKVNKSFGDINCLNSFDINDKIYNIEFKPLIYSKICTSAECSSILLNKIKNYIKIKLPSNKRKQLNNKCYAMYGNSEKIITNITNKAGTKMLLGNRPKVRGSAMNACDHPHGGGEGKAPIGKKSIYSFKGKKVKGVKTVKIKNDYKNTYLKRKYKNLNKYFIFKTYNKNLRISSLFNNTTIKVYNGIRFIPIKIDSLKFGLKCKYIINNV